MLEFPTMLCEAYVTPRTNLKAFGNNQVPLCSSVSSDSQTASFICANLTSEVGVSPGSYTHEMSTEGLGTLVVE